MSKSIIFLLLLALCFLGCQESGLNVETRYDFENTLEDLQKKFQDFTDDMRKIPESEEFKKLKKELERLIEEMKKSGKAAGEKIQKEVLPRLEKEIEKLREELRKFMEKEEEKPLRV